MVNYLLTGGGGAGGGAFATFVALKVFGKSNNQPECPANTSLRNLEHEIERMVEKQSDGNLILSRIEGALTGWSRHSGPQ